MSRCGLCRCSELWIHYLAAPNFAPPPAPSAALLIYIDRSICGETKTCEHLKQPNQTSSNRKKKTAHKPNAPYTYGMRIAVFFVAKKKCVPGGRTRRTRGTPRSPASLPHSQSSLAPALLGAALGLGKRGGSLARCHTRSTRSPAPPPVRREQQHTATIEIQLCATSTTIG